MAWARKSTSSGLWGGVYRDAAQHVQYLPMVHRTKTEATREASEEERRARRGMRHDPAGPRTKWGAWCDEWWPTRGVEASTEAGDRSYLARCRDRWDNVPVGMISRHDVQAWVGQMSREMAPASVRKPFYLLSSSLRAAISHGMIDTNPCVGVTLPVLPPAQERYLSDVEIDKVFYRLDERWRVFAELLLDSGMRVAEACGLHWERVNLVDGTVAVVETWDRETRTMKAYPKGRRVRTVPLTGPVVDMLVRWHDRHPDTGGCGRPHAADNSRRARARARAAAASRAGRRRADVGGEPTSCRSSLVICGARGAPIDAHNFGNREWLTAIKAAQIPHASPHDLRHTYASRTLSAGIDLARLSVLMGHASVTTTERYAWLIGNQHDDVRRAMEARAQRSRAERDAAHDAAGDAAGRPAEGQDGLSWMRLRTV